eukprot:PhM_4_TR5798/c0_g1_i2/m.20780
MSSSSSSSSKKKSKSSTTTSSCSCSDTEMCDAGETYRGSSPCSKDKTCGTCTKEVFLTGVCSVIDVKDVTHVSLYSNKKSCKYPFELTGEYGSLGTLVSVSFRDYRDPKIALEEITAGSNNFGLTAAQQIAIGLALTIIGAVIIAAMCGLAYCVYSMATVRQRASNMWGAATGRPVNSLEQPMHNMQQYLAGSVPPQPGYASPCAYYPQQPPSVGYAPQQQPAMGYVPQQPGYAQYPAPPCRVGPYPTAGNAPLY